MCCISLKGMTFFQFRGIQTHTCSSHKRINTSRYKIQWAQDRMMQVRQMCITIIGLILHHKLRSLRAESNLESTIPPGNIRIICLLAAREHISIHFLAWHCIWRHIYKVLGIYWSRTQLYGIWFKTHVGNFIPKGIVAPGKHGMQSCQEWGGGGGEESLTPQTSRMKRRRKKAGMKATLKHRIQNSLYTKQRGKFTKPAVNRKFLQFLNKKKSVTKFFGFKWLSETHIQQHQKKKVNKCPRGKLTS